MTNPTDADRDASSASKHPNAEPSNRPQNPTHADDATRDVARGGGTNPTQAAQGAGQSGAQRGTQSQGGQSGQHGTHGQGGQGGQGGQSGKSGTQSQGGQSGQQGAQGQTSKSGPSAQSGQSGPSTSKGNGPSAAPAYRDGGSESSARSSESCSAAGSSSSDDGVHATLECVVDCLEAVVREIPRGAQAQWSTAQDHLRKAREQLKGGSQTDTSASWKSTGSRPKVAASESAKPGTEAKPDDKSAHRIET